MFDCLSTWVAAGLSHEFALGPSYAKHLFSAPAVARGNGFYFMNPLFGGGEGLYCCAFHAQKSCRKNQFQCRDP
ncbi:hypothetical protein BJX76DRAFT_167393 [Aspergillus varians]